MAMADGPLQVAVAGGSIGGLCAGLALQRIAGAEVDIYERHVGEVETRGAGIVVQPELTQLLRLVDAAELPTTGCRVRRYLEPDGGEGSEQVMPQRFTSWEAIFQTLRSAFPDGRYLAEGPGFRTKIDGSSATNAKLSERQSSATMSLAGTMDETSSLWTLCSIAPPRSVRGVRLFRLFLADPMLGEPAADPKEKRGPASDKNWSC